MRDWELYVRTHLPPSALGQAREARIVRELGVADRGLYRDALAQRPERRGGRRVRRCPDHGLDEFRQHAREADRRHRGHESIAGPSDSTSGATGSPLVSSRRCLAGLIPGRPLRGADSFAGGRVRPPRSCDHGLGIGLWPRHSPSSTPICSSRRSAQPARAVLAELDTDIGYRQRFRLADYEALQPEAREFADVAAAQNARIRQEDVTSEGLLVTGNYFELLGARPMLGRLLRPEDSSIRGAGAVVVLSHQIWRSRYGADPSIIVNAFLDFALRVVGVTVTSQLNWPPGTPQLLVAADDRVHCVWTLGRAQYGTRLVASHD